MNKIYITLKYIPTLKLYTSHFSNLIDILTKLIFFIQTFHDIHSA